MRRSYHVRQRMIPSFFPPTLVRRIFECGKEVHFIRDALQDHKVLEFVAFSVVV